MNFNKLPRALVAALAGILSTVGAANAAFTLDFSDVGGNVLVTFSGSFNTTGYSSTFEPLLITSSVSTGPDNGGWTWIDSGDLVGVGNMSMFSIFVDSGVPVNDISNNEFSFTTTNHLGDAIYIWAYNDGTAGGFGTTDPYTSGDLISGSFEIAGASVSDLGIVATKWFTTTNGDDVFVTVGAVPEPSSALLCGVASLALAARRRR